MLCKDRGVFAFYGCRSMGAFRSVVINCYYYWGGHSRWARWS
jgi:hypothetical protein